jgi:hypothetical protein
MDRSAADRLIPLFGDQVGDPDWRRASYQLLEEHVDAATKSDGSVETDRTVARLQGQLRELSKERLGFLLVHSGFIPDHYGADSSQETLYTKLTEAVACEWGRRLGMRAELQKEKSSKEDVTFWHLGKAVVSDTKSFRLGRSQAAPNVKDAIKQGDYKKWLSAYPSEQRLGGLITFPSQHDWKQSSDAYLYVSAPDDRIMLLFYEHMAYLVLHAEDVQARGGVFSLLERYSNLFRTPSKNRGDYWSAILPEVSRLAAADDLLNFTELVEPIIAEAVIWAEARIEDRINRLQKDAEAHVAGLAEDVLRERLVHSIMDSQALHLRRYLENIRRFRK